jgi:hypothetical protein
MGPVIQLERADAELVRRFDAGSLGDTEFNHANHVRVAWAYLQLHGCDETLRRFPQALLRFATLKGGPEKFDAALTRDWILHIDDARRAHPEARTGDALLAACPELMDKSTVKRRL